MKTVVEIHRSAAVEYFDWIQRNSQPPFGSRDIAQVFDDELRAELIRTDGLPANAVQNTSFAIPYWIWRFNSNTWIRYVIKDRSTGLFGGVSRRVIITDFSETRLS